MLLPELAAATQDSEVSKARQVSREAAALLMGKEGKPSWPHGVAALQGDPFITPFPSLLVKGEDAAAPVQGGLTPQCS